MEFFLNRAILVLSILALSACKTTVDKSSKLDDVRATLGHDCTWKILDPIGQFKNSVTHDSFQKKYNPHITVSRRGYTARVIGTLTDEAVKRHGGMEDLLAKYPYVTEVFIRADHYSVPEDVKMSAAQRAKKENKRGQIYKTKLTKLPPHSIMIIYPVALARPGGNTIAGRYTIHKKIDKTYVANLGGQYYEFGGFPFLRYSAKGHAFHGPIYKEETQKYWHLSRGNVSSGCQRMQGEHIVELGYFLGCDGRNKCQLPKISSTSKVGGSDISMVTALNEQVDVIEDFDFIPPRHLNMSEDEVREFNRMADTMTDRSISYVANKVESKKYISAMDWDYLQDWIGVDVENYPLNDAAFRKQVGFKIFDDNKNPTHYILKKTMYGEQMSEGYAGIVPIVKFKTWENTNGGHPFVISTKCSKYSKEAREALSKKH